MKKLLLALTLSGFAFTGFANLNGNGYYRVLNYGSNRWANLVDNQAVVDKVSGSADLHSLELTKNTEEILSDPGSVVYISQKSNNQYDVAAQGITLESIVDNNISIRANGTGENNQSLYMLYGTYKGTTKYIGDANIMTAEEYGIASLNATQEKFKKWYILPLDVTSSNFFGAVPTVQAGGKSYTTLFASFGYKPYSEGVKAYYIGRVGYGKVEMIEITGTIPPGTPVILQCNGATAANNKLEITDEGKALPSNSLIGVYFDYNGPENVNQVPYDPETMRVLGTCSDGSLGFVTANNLKTIPGNTAYIKVAKGSAKELKCVSSEEFTEDLPSAPQSYYLNNESYPLYAQGEDIYSGTFQIPASEDVDLKIRFYSSTDESSYLAPADEDVILDANGSNESSFGYDTPYYWIIPAWEGGDITVSLNIAEETVTFNIDMAGIESILVSGQSLSYDGVTVYNNSSSGISIFNMAGQLLLSTKSSSLDISNLPEGVYVAVANGKSLKIKK